MITVLDASAAVAIALNLPGSLKFQPQLETSDLVIAPDLLVAEVSNAVWKYVKAGVIDSGQGDRVLERAMGLVDQIESSQVLYREAFALSVDQQHPVYDALYLVLARRNNAVLATFDRRLADLAAKLHIKIVL
jgi:predicted nucleic acid-binding protein